MPTRLRACRMLLIGSVLLVSSANAQKPGPRHGDTRSGVIEPLSPMAFLVGSCWSGPLPKGGVDTHCFSRVFDGQFVRDVHTVVGAARPYQGETLYHWDAVAKTVSFTYWMSLGGVSTGTMHVEPDRLVFPEAHETADGSRIEYRNVWFREGPDAYVAQTDARTATGWTQQFRILYKRRPL